MDILEKLYDFNTELTNDARIEIAESVQTLMELIGNLVELCDEEIADPEDCSALQSAKTYLKESNNG